MGTHPLPCSPHGLRNCNKRFCSFYRSHENWGSSYDKKFNSATIILKVVANLSFLIYTFGKSEKNRPTVQLIISNPGNGQKGCSSEVLYRSSYTKEAKIKFNPLLAYLRYFGSWLTFMARTISMRCNIFPVFLWVFDGLIGV